MLHSTPPEFRGYVTSHPKVMQPPLGTPDGTRTHTGSILSRLPLPIGLPGRTQSVSYCAGLHRSDSRRVYLPCPPQQITSDYRSHMAKPQTVDEYLQSHTGPARDLLTRLRDLRQFAGPGATEAIKWGHPAVLHSQGVILFAYSAHKQHANVVFTPSTRAAFADALTDLKSGKGSVSLPYGSAFPRALLEKMVEFRVREFEDHGVKWM